LVISSSYLVGSKKARRNHITSTTPPDYSVVFDARFSRYRGLLHFLATRVLGGSERADEAVGNCWLSASRNPPWFEYDGAFCGWLVRVLIDEALAIRAHREETNTATLPSEQVASSPSHSIKMEGTLSGGTK
jgi:DNA-directed RNA polymerase specialized sigma24 family protein